MLQHSFIHLPRIGTRSEQTLWKTGIRTWKDFLTADEVTGISIAKKPACDRLLKQAQHAVFAGNSEYFTCLPSVEQWRCYSEFADQACFVDIETNYRNDITVLGVSDGVEVWQFVRHHNMIPQDIKQLLSRFKLIITFNGASFDLPIIRRYFSDVIPNIPHIDLRHAGARAGLRGGLKSIEKQIGIDRGEELEGVSGADALKLWHAYRSSGNTQFRDILLKYNAEDVLNLKPLAEHVTKKLQQELLIHHTN